MNLTIIQQIRNVVQKKLSEKSKDNYWKNYINRNAYLEKKIENFITDVFQEQMDEILTQLDTLTVSKGGPGSGIRGHRTYRPEKESRRKRRIRGHVSGLSIHQRDAVIKQLIDDTDTDKQKAEEYFDSVVRYSGVDYAKIRSGRDKETADKIEEFIDNSPKWDGNGYLYRGLNMQNISHWKEGKVINMKGVSSWSDDEKIAQDFSKVEGFTARKNVIFVLPGSDNGTSIKHLSANPHENEVLVSKYTLFKINKIEPKGDYVYIKVNELIRPKETSKTFTAMTVKEAKGQMTIHDKWKYDSENELIELEEEITVKGGPGSGSWESPGNPRFQHQGAPEDIKTGHERFRQGSKVGVQAKKQEGEKPKVDRSKIERFQGEDPRRNVSKEGKYMVLYKKKTGDKLYKTIREPDTVETRTIKKTGEKVKVAIPGKLKFEDGSDIPKTDKRIPPAWTHIYVNKKKNGEVQVEGLDKVGEVQSLYSKAHDDKMSEIKQRRVNQKLLPQFNSLYKAVDNDVKKTSGQTRDTAACLRLIMSTGIRPTDENDAPEKRGAKKAYGAITLLGQHVFANKGSVYVELPAKKGTTYKAEIKDSKIAADLIRRKNKAGKDGRIFDTDSSLLLNYSKGKTGFLVKDYRTLKANQEADKIMKGMSKPNTEKAFKEAVKKVTTHVSGILCNTPGMAFESYIDKLKWEPWKKGITFKTKSIYELVYLELIE